MSEAGCPGVADPGAVIVKLAHEKKGIQVVPLVGPSSILLAMMASGMNGQSLRFTVIYPLKREKKSSPKNLEKISLEKIISNFIETPYRNNKMWKISYRLYILKPICVLLLILLYQPNISKQESICLEKKTSICTIDPPFYHP
jgi:16S rRNA (cytidine1402-2'-O)-methyltransferase